MPGSACTPLLGPEFDDFLFAPLGEERNGVLLSVLSALARLELDPWHEANSLAGLTGAAAAKRLTSLINLLPDEPSPRRASAIIAACLVALLPRHGSSNISLSQILLGPKRGLFKSVIWVIWIVIALGARWIGANRQPPVWGSKTHALAAETISRPTPPDPLRVSNQIDWVPAIGKKIR